MSGVSVDKRHHDIFHIEDVMEEKPIWSGTPSHWTNFWWYAACFAIVPIGIGLLIAGRSDTTQSVLYIWYAAAVIALVPIPFAMARWFRVRFTRYSVSTQRIIITTGVFTRKTEEFELYRVKDYSIESPFFLRLVRRANIIMNTSDKSMQTFTLKAVPSAEQLRNDIRASVEVLRDTKRVREVDYE
jgi:uncharacterized membrane protein YdbT with pleckstrin-like domain